MCEFDLSKVDMRHRCANCTPFVAAFANSFELVSGVLLVAPLQRSDRRLVSAQAAGAIAKTDREGGDLIWIAISRRVQLVTSRGHPSCPTRDPKSGSRLGGPNAHLPSLGKGTPWGPAHTFPASRREPQEASAHLPKRRTRSPESAPLLSF